jgi:hypothetical protein
MSSLHNPLDSWINALDDHQVEARLVEINAAIDELEAERSLLTQALTLQRQWRARAEIDPSEETDEPKLTSPMVPVPEAHRGLGGPAPTGKVEAALRVLGAHGDRDWTARAIGDKLVSLGWMEDTEKDYDSLASTMSRLAKERKIHRPRRGVYRLRPSGDAPVA